MLFNQLSLENRILNTECFCPEFREIIVNLTNLIPEDLREDLGLTILSGDEVLTLEPDLFAKFCLIKNIPCNVLALHCESENLYEAVLRIPGLTQFVYLGKLPSNSFHHINFFPTQYKDLHKHLIELLKNKQKVQEDFRQHYERQFFAAKKRELDYVNNFGWHPQGLTLPVYRQNYSSLFYSDIKNKINEAKNREDLSAISHTICQADDTESLLMLLDQLSAMVDNLPKGRKASLFSRISAKHFSKAKTFESELKRFRSQLIREKNIAQVDEIATQVVESLRTYYSQLFKGKSVRYINALVLVFNNFGLKIDKSKAELSGLTTGQDLLHLLLAKKDTSISLMRKSGRLK